VATADAAPAEERRAQLYLVIACGVGGIMPAWVDGLSAEKLWALAHYVDSLRPARYPDSEH
jgi:hypothetical protein